MAHDQLFKELLKTFFRDFLELVDPGIAELLSLEHRRFLDKEHFTDFLGGARREMDLVAEVPVRDEIWTPKDSEQELILVHVEVEARFLEETGRRLWHYFMQLKTRHPESPILPIVLYLQGGPAGVEIQTHVCETLGFEVSRFTFYSFGLSGADAGEYLDRPQALAWALAALMRPIPGGPVEQKLASLRRIARHPLGQVERFLLRDTVETYIQLNDEERSDFEDRLAHELPEVRTMEITWSNQHFTRGKEEGRQEGKLEGMRGMLQSLLERRFGALSDANRRRLEAIGDPDALDRLGDRIFVARDLDAVFAED